MKLSSSVHFFSIMTDGQTQPLTSQRPAQTLLEPNAAIKRQGETNETWHRFFKSTVEEKTHLFLLHFHSAQYDISNASKAETSKNAHDNTIHLPFLRYKPPVVCGQLQEAPYSALYGSQPVLHRDRSVVRKDHLRSDVKIRCECYFSVR